MKKITGCGLLPYACYNGKLYILLGREQYPSLKFSDFGGHIEFGEKSIQCAIREGYEETMGILGNQSQLKEMVDDKKNITVDTYNCYLLKTSYDKNLPNIYRNIYNYFTKCAQTKHGRYVIPSCPEGWFEKKEIKWYEMNDLKKQIKNNNNSFNKRIKKIINFIDRYYMIKGCSLEYKLRIDDKKNISIRNNNILDKKSKQERRKSNSKEERRLKSKSKSKRRKSKQKKSKSKKRRYKNKSIKRYKSINKNYKNNKKGDGPLSNL